MKIAKSARKHGILDDDIKYVYDFARNLITLREEPEKVMLFGFDTSGRALEVGYIVNDQGETIIIHAMKLRTCYIEYFQA